MVITGSTPNQADVDEVNIQNKSLQVVGGYLDLGQVIATTNMAAGATVWSNWFDNVQWVRNLKILAASDQQYDLFLNSRDTSLSADYGPSLITNQSLTGGSAGSPIYRNHNYICSTVNGSGGNGMLGYSVRIGIKNTSASPNTYASVRVQLMGL